MKYYNIISICTFGRWFQGLCTVSRRTMQDNVKEDIFYGTISNENNEIQN